MQLRTDLAVEEREIVGDELLKGIEYAEETKSGMKITKINIKNQRASRALHKEKGSYITVDLPKLTDNFTQTDEKIISIGEEIRRLLPVNGLVLVVGLGNTEITADALGPKSALNVLATRHITGELARSSGLDRLRGVAVLVPGVTGQTGIETGEYVQSIVKNIKPNAVVAIDALASRRTERLGSTLQISDTGISPGAGVGNHRSKINQDSLGVPVISIGIPTVVDALTLASDLLNITEESERNSLLSKISPDGCNMVVTPKEIDLLTERGAKIIGMALNYALQREITVEELAMLT